MSITRYSRRKPEKSSFFSRMKHAGAGAIPPGDARLRSRLLFFGGHLFAAALACSLIMHLISGAALLRGVNFARFEHSSQPTLYVDLVAPPVARPRQSEGETAAAAPAHKEQPFVPAAAPRNEVLVPSKNKKASKPAPAVEDDIRQSLAAMRQRRDDRLAQEETDAAIAALKKARTAPAQTPALKPTVGSASGNGSEAGGRIDDWIRQQLRDSWKLSRYQLDGRRDLSARVELEFDGRGKLSGYRFVRSSENQQFNDSLRRAILNLKPLPNPPTSGWKTTATFTLDDLLDD